MSRKHWKLNHKTKKSGLLLAAGVLAAQRMLAQSQSSLLISQPPVVTTPQVVQDDVSNNEMNVFIPNGAVNSNPNGLFQYGPVALHPHANYMVTYGNGLQSSVGNAQNTIIQQLSPGITADLGRHWTADYTPTINFYSNRAFRDNVGQSASLAGATSYNNWNFGLSQSYSHMEDPTAAGGGQDTSTTYNTALTGAYAFNDKWSANAAVNQSFNFVKDSQDSYDWTGTEGVNYQFWPRLSAGMSVAEGYTIVRTDTGGGAGSNPDMVNQQLQGNIAWRATDKISFQGSAGFEELEYLGDGYQNSLQPIFSAAVQYQPFAHTQISLSGSRTVGSSDYYIIAQSTEMTTVTLGLNQQLLKDYNLNLGLSYTREEFTTAIFTISEARTDNIYSFNASLGRSFFQHWNWSVSYQYTDDESDIGGYAQRNNQISFQIGVAY